ncbi:ParB family protein [Pseudomonas sp. B392_1p]|uniref:ParB family protein n=1 Tax=Pseudomonas sp. B392_1p TaxID=3457507 RepID=UPI003FD1C60B
MADLTPQEMASKMLADGFSRSGPIAEALSDPIAETPMVVTLDDLRPYELDPRITRNPLYDEIKASIRERGLDAPPSITRRPGADHYIIRNGGNTRLSILRELWSETKNEHFFRIPCLFRPWPERGEIIALTGHLAENELHGGLTFIERALGVEKARELYEQESGKPLSQSELARRLSGDGYPVQQSHISRMQDTVRYLLPVIPNVLYNGLGRHQVERLAVLRKAAELSWQRCAAGKSLTTDYDTLFNDVLAPFDSQPEAFSVARARDELVGQMADLLGADYNVLELEIDSTEHRQRVVTSAPLTLSDATPDAGKANVGTAPKPQPKPAPAASQGNGAAAQPPAAATDTPSSPSAGQAPTPSPPPEGEATARVQDHIVSPAATTERLQAIQQLVAEQTGDPLPVFADTVLQAIPVQAGGLFPITDIWYIEPGLDSPDRLRIHIAQFAHEIAEEAELTDCIEPLDAGIGFSCKAPQYTAASRPFARMVLTLLHALSVHYDVEQSDQRLSGNLGALLLGADLGDAEAPPRLSDTGLVKLFRLVRLARRRLDLEANPDVTDD